MKKTEWQTLPKALLVQLLVQNLLKSLVILFDTSEKRPAVEQEHQRLCLKQEMIINIFGGDQVTITELRCY